MTKRLIKPISFESRHFQIDNIFYNKNGKWYVQSNRENDVVPSYINMNDKEYFEDVIETKFKINDHIIYKHKVYKINNIFNYDGGLRKSFIRFTIEHANNSKYVIELSEKMINECSITKEYFFIDSKGKIQKTYLHLDLYADSFRKIVNNMFDNIENARKHLQELIK